MAPNLSISLNGRHSFGGKCGDLILDAALRSGVDLPHDCRSGYCGSCTISLEKGLIFGGETASAGQVRACQARLFSDLAIRVDPTPPTVVVSGNISTIETIAKNTVAVSILTKSAMEILPGQYCKVKFKGFPERCFSPTADMQTGGFSRHLLYFHIKQTQDGRVTPEIGTRINVGHKVRVTGPLGHAYHRRGRDNRLVLVGTGTGFAPIWAVAAAALEENPDREIALIAGTRRASSFYMGSALRHAARYSNVKILPFVDDMPSHVPLIYRGGLKERLPKITPDDIVFAAGAPVIVEDVKRYAERAGATFYSDPFHPTH
ncbi:2Fe-2S iron-sulfur cluster binding domain-containing protein [Aurantimonas sp. NFXS3]|uniref:2Fe-2S iron-sulfur cluster binding domain-containing protein n=1 Tax=Aurantimonas sp. NFXS3 TaxID=2818434 RepID=UPI003B8E45DF